MRESSKTTRRRLADRLREEPATPTALAAEFDLTPDAVCSHLEHVARSLAAADDGDEHLLVAPPECRDCGFDGFDDRLNRPSRCPSCKSESVADPTVTVE